MIRNRLPYLADVGFEKCEADPEAIPRSVIFTLANKSSYMILFVMEVGGDLHVNL